VDAVFAARMWVVFIWSGAMDPRYRLMASYVLTVAGGKGGVGKTTTAVNVGAALQEMGQDVVVVDADLGMANLGGMLEIEYERSLHEILAGDAGVSEALEDATGGLTIIPGEQRLEAFADADPAELRKVIETLRNAYDIVVIDTGAGLSHEVAVPLGLANGIILVTTPDAVAIGDTVKTAELSERIDGTVLGTVLNRVNRQTDVAKIDDRFKVPVLAVIPDEPQATSSEPLVLKAPESNAADAVRMFAKNLEEYIYGEVDIADLDIVIEKSWFDEEETEDDEEEDSDGRFGLFG
jgi:septum site-determining protein MinD